MSCSPGHTAAAAAVSRHRASSHCTQLPAGLGWAGLGWAGLGCAGLMGWAGLGAHCVDTGVLSTVHCQPVELLHTCPRLLASMLLYMIPPLYAQKISVQNVPKHS